jgi:hypothetical protein
MPNEADRKPPSPATDRPQTLPGEERGERVDTGRTIGRGGRAQGDVPGADESGPPDERAGRT